MNQTTRSILTILCAGAMIHCGDANDLAGTQSQLGSGGNNVIQTGSGTLRLRCETRDASRSKVSVDASNVASGDYYAVIRSGTNESTSSSQSTVGDEIEFDFDSDPTDVAEGATSISADFAASGVVGAELRTSNGEIVLTGSVGCEKR